MTSAFDKLTTRRTFVWSAAAGGLVLASATPWRSVLAAPSKIRQVDFVPRKHVLARGTHQFGKYLKELSGGELTTQFIGGPSVINAFQIGGSISKGVFDMAHVAPAYYATLMPEADSIQVVEAPMAKVRKSGAFALYASIMRKRMNTVLLGTSLSGAQFMIMTKDPIRKLADFKGRKIRSTATYDALLKQLGAATIRISPAETYTALERGVADGLAWPEFGFVPFRYHEVANNFLRPGIFAVRSVFIMNQGRFEKYAPAQQKVILEAALKAEAWGEKFVQGAKKREFAIAAKSGVQIHTLPDNEAKQFVNLAEKIQWEKMTKLSPNDGPKLKQLFVQSRSL